MTYIRYKYEKAVEERDKLHARFEEIAQDLEGRMEMPERTRWMNKEQKLVWEVCNWLKNIGQIVCIRAVMEGKVFGWG